MRYIVDACVFMRAQDAGLLDRLLAACSAINAALAEEVYREVADTRGVTGAILAKQQAAQRSFAASPIEHLAIGLGTPASTIYGYLRAGRTTPTDAGECASIALAATVPDAAFVTDEVVAAYLALSQIGARVEAMPRFLCRLCGPARPMLTISEAHRIATVRAGGRLPYWWAEWQSGGPGPD